MSVTTGIEWTDSTWNPVRGCTLVSEGCRNCYAMHVAARFSGPGQAYEGLARRRSNGEPQWTGRVAVIERHMMDPLRWHEPRRIFVNSMSDLFHENVSDETIDRVFAVMLLAKQHTFQILTKRPERMRDYISAPGQGGAIAAALSDELDKKHVHPAWRFIRPDDVPWPLPNVWLGTSTENQAAAEERIPFLIQTPAAVRFLSCEPLLGPIDLRRCTMLDLKTIDWVIVGGESGPHARDCDLNWIRNLVTDCKHAGIACFVKQFGTRPQDRNDLHSDLWPGATVPFADNYTPTYQGEIAPLKLASKKGGDIEEWPADLRIREFPTVPA